MIILALDLAIQMTLATVCNTNKCMEIEIAENKKAKTRNLIFLEELLE